MFQRYSLVHDHPCSYQIFVVIELAPEYFVQCLFSCIFSRLVVWDSGTSTDAVLFLVHNQSATLSIKCISEGLNLSPNDKQVLRLLKIDISFPLH